MAYLQFRKLKADEIEVRVATVSEKGASLLLYKDARVDQRLLDETVGAMCWQREHQEIGGNLYCTVSIYFKDLDMWVSKQDVGTESNTEKEKGQASDSFKRACFNWGIGRELYTAPFIWLDITRAGAYEDRGKWKTRERFKVSRIGYDNAGNINDLEIVNEKSKAVVYTMNGKADPAPKARKSNKKTEPAPEPVPEPAPEEPTAQTASDTITDKEAAALAALCKRKGVEANTFNGKKFSDLTPQEYANACRQLGDMKDKE